MGGGGWVGGGVLGWGAPISRSDKMASPEYGGGANIAGACKRVGGFARSVLELKTSDIFRGGNYININCILFIYLLCPGKRFAVALRACSQEFREVFGNLGKFPGNLGKFSGI